jgi:PII-like signaling protein
VTLPREGQLLRIFIGESDRWGGKPLYEAIVRRRGSEAWRGPRSSRASKASGPGASCTRTRILRLSEDLPVVVEIVDTEEKIQAFLPALDEMVKEGLATVEKATVIFYRGGERPHQD